MENRPELFTLSGQSVLGFRAHEPGTGNFWAEHYFVYEGKLKKPVEIDQSAIRRAIDDALPNGYEVRKGGGLDFKALRYESPIWKDGDGNALSSGGRVLLELALDGSTLRVESVEYTPQACNTTNNKTLVIPILE